MKPPRNGRRLLALGALLILVAVFAGVFAKSWCVDQLCSPPRRSLQDYHREILADPAARGMSIKAMASADGAPLLVCEPAGTLSGRGEILRSQLGSDDAQVPGFGTVVGNLVLVHGRNGRKEDYLPIAERLCAVGFRCVLPDLPAHGDHPAGVVTGGLAERHLPAQALAEAAKTFGFDPQPAGLFGISMGGSVAVHSAAEPDSPWRALVIVASFDEYRAVARSHVERHLGTSLGALWSGVVEESFEKKAGVPLSSVAPAKLAPRIGMPVLVAHGTADSVVPLESGRTLFDAFSSAPVRQWIEVPDAGHDNVLITDFPIYKAIAAWMLEHVPER